MQLQDKLQELEGQLNLLTEQSPHGRHHHPG